VVDDDLCFSDYCAKIVYHHLKIPVVVVVVGEKVKWLLNDLKCVGHPLILHLEKGCED